MKRIGIIFILFFAFGVSANAQEKTDESPKRIKLYKTEKKTLSTQEQIDHEKSVIEAIEKKEKYVRENPEQHKIAEENGWYDKMAEQRKAHEAKIAELEARLKKESKSTNK